MILTGLIIVAYGIVLLELLFNDSMMLVRYLHFGYLAIFIVSVCLMMLLTVRSFLATLITRTTRKTTKQLWFLPAFIFICFQYLAPFFSEGYSTASDEELGHSLNKSNDFKLLSFSVNSRNKDYDNVTQLLMDNPADVVCLQEVPYSRYTLFTKAMKKKGLNYHHVYSRKKSLMILSTKKITPHKTMPYLQATVELDGQAVKVWNLHSPKSLNKENYQNFYFDKLKADIKADTSTHKLVCGDFNSTPHNTIVSEFNTMFQAAYKQSTHPFQFTYPTSKGIIPSPIPFLKIDYLFFTSNFKINNYQRIAEHANSDHYPIMATASLATASASRATTSWANTSNSDTKTRITAK